MELWDVYDIKGNKLNKTHVRGNKLLEGEYHLVCDCLVKHVDGSFLLMKRHPQKEVYPNYYESSAGGSALVGESPLQCVKRELQEETGIESDNFILIDVSSNKERHAIYYSYLCIVNCNKNSIILQEEETIDYKWVYKEEFKEYIISNKLVKTQIERLKSYLETLEIGNEYRVVIDRPLGSVHPNHKNIKYTVNYGYIPGIIGGDGEEQDAYVLGVNEPLKEFKGKLIGVVIRENDNETKWIISNRDYSEEKILEKINFQEKYFKHKLFK